MAKQKPAVHLVVVAPFGDYSRGDRITDADTIKAIQEGESSAYVVAVAAPLTEPAS